MPYTNLIKRLNAFQFLPLEYIEELKQKLKITPVQKNQILIASGQSVRKLAFLDQGLAMAYKYINNKKYITRFWKSNQFICMADSLFNQVNTNQSVQILEDSLLITLNIDDVHQLYNNFPIAAKISDSILADEINELENRLFITAHTSAQERFSIFMKEHKDLYPRLLKEHIASYLGISYKTLVNLKIE